MEHEAAVARLEEWVAGRLDSVTAAEMDAHLAVCGDCRGVAETLPQVRAQVATHGESLFMPHPSAQALAQFVLDPHGLTLDSLAGIGAHLRTCPACAAEREHVREATSYSLPRKLGAWLGSGPGPAAWLRPALAVIALALVYPAYVGLIEYPRARERADRLEAIARTPTIPAPATTAWSGGGVDALLLSGATRGSSHPVPAIRIRPGQPAQPIMIDYALPVDADPVTVTLRAEGASVSWRFEGRRSEVWDARQGLVAVLIPADELPPGDYRLSIRSGGSLTSEFSARFRVLPRSSP